MPRVPAHWLDPSDGDPGQVPKINEDGTEVEWADPSGGGIQSVVPGTNVTVDDADPANPVVSATAVHLVPLTTEVNGTPAFVWDDDNQLVMTEVTL